LVVDFMSSTRGKPGSRDGETLAQHDEAVTTHERRPGGLESLGDLYAAVPASEAIDVEEDAQRGGPPRMLLDLVLCHGAED